MTDMRSDPYLRDLAVMAERITTQLTNNQEPHESGKRMKRGGLITVGCYLAVLGTAALAIAPWAWSLAVSSIDTTAGPRAHFLGLAFTPTTEFSLIIIVMLMAVLGSLAVLILTFSNRAGHETLERGYLWWYLLRPIEAAAVGVLFYMAIIAGFFNQVSATGRPALVLAAAIGGLAGLFTDKVLEKMRDLLGLRQFSKAASGSGGKSASKAPADSG